MTKPVKETEQPRIKKLKIRIGGEPAPEVDVKPVPEPVSEPVQEPIQEPELEPETSRTSQNQTPVPNENPAVGRTETEILTDILTETMSEVGQSRDRSSPKPSDQTLARKPDLNIPEAKEVSRQNDFGVMDRASKPGPFENFMWQEPRPTYEGGFSRRCVQPEIPVPRSFGFGPGTNWMPPAPCSSFGGYQGDSPMPFQSYRPGENWI